MQKYSDAEIRLFTFLGFKDLLDSELEPPCLYRVACEQAFLDNDVTVEAAALRRGANIVLRFHVSGPKRMTKEFDDLIRIDR